MLPFTKVAQDGDDGANTLFPVEHFEEVAKIMRPKRRRRMTEEQRRVAADRLAKYAFTAARQRPETEHTRDPGAVVV